MCGIVGIFTPGLATDQQLRLFMDLLYVDKARGEHATGVIKIQPYQKKVETFKRAVSSQVFLGQQDAFDFMDKGRGRIYIGHNRYATMGDKSKDDNAHPFTEGHITMVHNGGVDRWALDKLEGYTDPEIVVDSHMLCKTIAEHGINEAIKRFSGAAALVWWDDNEKSLNFLRNAERPLFLCELKDGTVAWASEKRFLDFFISHDKSRLDYAVEPKPLPIHKHVSFHFSEHGVLQNKKPTVRDLEFTRMEDPSPKTYGGYGNNWGWWNRRDSSNTPSNVTPMARNVNDAVKNYDNRVNSMLTLWGIDAKIGKQIKVEIVKVEAMSTNSNSCNVHGLWDNTDVVAYNVPRSKLDGRHYFLGNIVNACERRYPEGYNLIELVVGGNTVTDIPAEAPKPEEKAVSVDSVIYSPTFPMKVNGGTFHSRAEFTSMVRGGCELCGKVPTAWDKHNAHITIYKHASTNPTMWDFVCGECITEKELNDVDLSTP